MSKKVDRKMASSQTIIVKSPYGKGSKGGIPTRPVFTNNQAPNQRIWRYTKTILPEKEVMTSARRSCTVRSCAVWRRSRVMVRMLRSMTWERSGRGTSGSLGIFACSCVMRRPLFRVISAEVMARRASLERELARVDAEQRLLEQIELVCVNELEDRCGTSRVWQPSLR